MEPTQNTTENNPLPIPEPSFYERPQVHVERIPIGGGVPIGIERVSNPAVGIGGAYGSWGESYDNEELPRLYEQVTGEALANEEKFNLAELGFLHRQHIPALSEADNLALEVEVGARFLREAARASGWEPGEVDAVLVGNSGPVSTDYVERIAQSAGIPDGALKVSIHKACDGSVAGLNLALNPGLPYNQQLSHNLAESLMGKKVLVGGIEGLSRFLKTSRDKNALQFFGNGAGVIGLVPGQTMKFLVGSTREVFDEEGVLAVRMFYPHSGQRLEGQSNIEVSQPRANFIRIAGLMHEPDGGNPIAMAGMMGMVKLFVRNGVQVVQEVYAAYQQKMAEMGMPGKEIAVAIVHHANLKINLLIEKTLEKAGIHFPMPWLLNDFGNVSAASNMIAFLRKLSSLNPGDHILFDGFGAGTYYDVLAVELGGTG
ncbi:MAG TPA: 3-oxoacyl-[acyl-carrier-protein] synthase III C-terminal domain-containing protein [Anaerolineales bacterium]|nr:3-oxoacyl-[acyl-carrier-protein] synthase III C-terminal domain-containing protein [Anaerolineales bacterium]